MSVVHNERWKLTATALNGVAIATVAAGVIAPLVAASYGVTGSNAGLYSLLTSVIWYLTGMSLHLIARRILGRLKE